LACADDLEAIDSLPGIHEIKPTYTPSDVNIPDNYVSHTIANQKFLPPVTWSNLIWNIQWISFLALTITPALTIYGICTTNYNRNTAIWR
jgi:stearoyl-CoA desaturase (delta-9 desaturase)